MPLWLLLAGTFAGWIFWSSKRTPSGAANRDALAQSTKKSATIGALTFALMMVLRLGPWRAWALLSSAISAWPILARFLQASSNTDRPQRDPATASSPLTRAEAAQLLDVPANAPRDAIEAAYRRLMSRVHPDAGGNAYLAQLVNEARDRLLS